LDYFFVIIQIVTDEGSYSDKKGEKWTQVNVLWRGRSLAEQKNKVLKLVALVSKKYSGGAFNEKVVFFVIGLTLSRHSKNCFGRSRNLWNDLGMG
jgi:hypothetical protein